VSWQYDRQHTGLLCFEEPENGIHPFRIEAMARLLKELTVDFKDTEMPLRQSNSEHSFSSSSESIN
jgi:hypothetical protein